MEEIEVPTEKLQEEIHHHAEHSSVGWFSAVALTSALLAVLAAVTALLAGHHANEAMIEQMKASDLWSHYQSKSIKSALVTSKTDILSALGHKASEKDEEKIAEYKKELSEIQEQAKEKETASGAHMRVHEIFARGVTMFQVAIGIAAIAVLTRKRRFWYVGIAFGCIGTAFLIQGLL